MDNNRQDKSTQFGGFFLICSFLIFVLLLTFLFNRTLFEDKKTITVENGASSTLIVQRGRDNHFHIDAKLNDFPINLLIDTGASYLTISQDLANILKLPNYGKISASTANGETLGIISRLQNLTLGGITLPNVKVIIAPNLASDQGLLGVNVLKYFNITQNANSMLLTINTNEVKDE